MESSDGIIVFRLGTEPYGVTLEAVREIGRIPPVTPIPGAESFVVGVCNLRGNILALLDLHSLFEIDADSQIEARKNRMLVLNWGGLTAGLLVDQVEGVLDTEEYEVDPPVPGAPDGLRPWLAGHIRTGSLGTVALLDPGILPALRDRIEGAAA